jgi:O-antigen ligase
MLLWDNMSVFKGSQPLPRGGVALQAPAAPAKPPVAAVQRPSPPPGIFALTPGARFPRPLIDPRRQADLANPMRRIGFYFAIAFVFVRFGMVHEALAFYLNVQTHLIPILGIPCALAMVASGGIRRTLYSRSAFFWLAMTVWLLLATAFSSWHGGSFALISGYVRTGFIMLFIIAGLVMTWKECTQMMYAIAFSVLVNLVTVGSAGSSGEADRLALSLQGASIGNANDLAAHLLLVLSFVLFALMTRKSSWAVKVIALAGFCLGLYDVVRTGSRGALVAIGVGIVFIFLRGPRQLRVATLTLVPIAGLVLILLLPKATLSRYSTLFSSSAAVEDKTAEDSSAERAYLLQTSASFSLQHPLFGVGPGEFQDIEAAIAKENNRHASWLVPHNSFTQLSSEAGIPSLLFLIAALGSGFAGLMQTYKRARSRVEFQAIANGAFCVMLAILTFCTAIFFLSLVYFFYLPSLGGMAIAVKQAADAEFAKAEAVPAG